MLKVEHSYDSRIGRYALFRCSASNMGSETLPSMEETPIGLCESVNSRGGDCVPPDDILFEFTVCR
jgi:hypothetical protein